MQWAIFAFWMGYNHPVRTRHVTGDILASLADSPVTMLLGARQTGKSTLAQAIAAGPHPADYLTLDDAVVLAAASADPQGFVAGLGGAVVLDEVQRVPALFPAIKIAVDRERRPGRFFLTGSANVLLLPAVSESLAGRMELHTLWPFSQGEVDGVMEGFVERLFGWLELPPAGARGLPLEERMLRGGYPPAVERATARGREGWIRSYVSTVLQRDVRDLANIERLAELPRLLQLLAARASGHLNLADLSRTLGIPQTTLQRYVTLLEHVFIAVRIPAWYANIGQRLVKSPKLLVNDSALMAHLLGLSSERLARERTLAGALLENFVGMELLKQCSWSKRTVRLLHYRTAKGMEVDFVLEDASGLVAGVEVKAAATVGASDLRGLRALADRIGSRFAGGVILYTGDTVVPVGERLAVWPVEALWAP